MVNIYILQLEDNSPGTYTPCKGYKYYIGKTTQPDIRLESHFNSNGSSWTKKYKPIKVLEIIPNCDEFDEDKYTLKYMEKYGINSSLRERIRPFRTIMLEGDLFVKLNLIKKISVRLKK